MEKKVIGAASLFSVGILFGLSGVIAKYLSGWLNPYQVVEYRFLVAFVICLMVLLWEKQKLSFKKIDIKTLIIFAITFPASVIFFTLAIFNTSVSLSVFSFYIANLVSSFVVGRYYFDEKVTRNKKMSLVFILLAVLAFTNPFKEFQLEVGFIFGLLSGLIQTIASSFQKIVGKSTNRLGLLLIQTFAGAGISAGVLVFTGEKLFTVLPEIGLIITVLYGIIFLLISYLFLVGFKYVDLNTGSVLVSSELFFGPFFALIFLSERLSLLELSGGVFVAIAVWLVNKKL